MREVANGFESGFDRLHEAGRGCFRHVQRDIGPYLGKVGFSRFGQA